MSLSFSLYGRVLPALVLLSASSVLVVAQDAARSDDMRALGRCEGCVFEEQNFAGHRLIGIDLSDARLERVVFENADLNVSVFDDAILHEVNFAGADLRGASFVGARLSDVSFEGADLRGAVFEGATLERTDLQPALLCNTQTPLDEMDNSDCD